MTSIQKEIKLYKGEVTLFYSERTFREEKYQTFFDKNDDRIKSVTGIIKCLDKPALKFWAANMAAEYFFINWDPKKKYTKQEMIEFAKKMASAHSQELRAKGDRGKLIHKYAED